MTLIEEIHRLQDNLEAQGIIFCYSGYLTEEMLLGMGNTIKQKLALADADPKAARAVFAIYIEQAQNVIRYSSYVLGDPDDDEASLRHGFLTIGKRNGDYFVCCSNMVQQGDVDRLRSHLEHIQSLDKDGLKTLYRETLRGEIPEGSKGAGVGFVDIARRAKGGFEFGFKPIDDRHAYFSLKAFV